MPRSLSLPRILALLLSVTFVFPVCVMAQQAEQLRSSIASLNRRIAIEPRFRAGTRSNLQSDLLPLLRLRQRLVEELIRTAPGTVRSVMLPADLSDRLRSQSVEYAGAIETQGEWTGELEATVGDDFEHGKSTTLWSLHVGETRMAVFFADGQNPMAHLYATVTVSGIATSQVISAESVRSAPTTTNPQTAVTACSTVGQENVAVLLMNQPTGGPTYPDPSFGNSTYWQPRYFGTTPKSVDDYWGEASFSTASATGTFFGTPTASYTFSQNFDGCTMTDQMASDAIGKAITAGVDFSTYSRVSIIFPVNSCGFGGLGTIGCRSADSQINHPYSVTWIPVFNFYNTTQYDLWNILAHELGHNLGLNHSSSIDFGTIPLGAIDYSEATSGTGSAGTGVAVEYGDPYTIMGGESSSCGGQYTAFNKAEYLTWLSPATDVTEVTGTSGTFAVVPFENSSGVRALRVMRDPLSSSWLWLEHRQALGNYDSDFATCVPGTTADSGALTYYESPYSGDGHLFLVDMNPTATPNNFTTAALNVSQTWNDPYSLLSLTLNSANSSGMSVTATYAQPCATLQISNNGTFTAAGSGGTVTVTAPNTCSWTATTVDSWITINSGASGTGNGTVAFTVGANAGIEQRTGYITVQRQSVPLVEAGSGTFIGNLNPVFQQGFSGTPTFTFNDPLGIADINSVDVKWQADICHVSVLQVPQGAGQPAIWFAFLLDPSTNLYQPQFGIQLGAAQSVSNNSCTFNGGTSSISFVGNQANITLGMTFASAFGGSHRVTATVCDGANSNCSAPYPSDVAIGTWQVATPAVPMINSVTPNSGKQGAAVPIAIVGANTHFSGASTVSVSGTGVVASGVSATTATQLGATLTIDPNATASSRTLTVTTNAEIVTTSFTVTASGQVQLSKSSLNFGNQNPYTTSASQPVMLTNNGHATLNISSITPSGEFAVSSSTCGSTLGVGLSCAVNVDFQPIHVANRTGTLTITDDAPNSAQSVTLSGYGNFILPISRPGRPGRPLPVLTGVSRQLTFKLISAGIIDSVPLTCIGTKRISCAVESVTPEGEFTIALNTRKARPGRYTLYLSTSQEISESVASVPIVVKSAPRKTRGRGN